MKMVIRDHRETGKWITFEKIAIGEFFFQRGFESCLMIKVSDAGVFDTETIKTILYDAGTICQVVKCEIHMV